jgi:hypothetical protein
MQVGLIAVRNAYYQITNLPIFPVNPVMQKITKPELKQKPGLVGLLSMSCFHSCYHGGLSNDSVYMELSTMTRPN